MMIDCLQPSDGQISHHRKHQSHPFRVLSVESTSSWIFLPKVLLESSRLEDQSNPFRHGTNGKWSQAAIKLCIANSSCLNAGAIPVFLTWVPIFLQKAYENIRKLITSHLSSHGCRMLLRLSLASRTKRRRRMMRMKRAILKKRIPGSA